TRAKTNGIRILPLLSKVCDDQTLSDALKTLDSNLERGDFSSDHCPFPDRSPPEWTRQTEVELRAMNVVSTEGNQIEAAEAEMAQWGLPRDRCIGIYHDILTRFVLPREGKETRLPRRRNFHMLSIIRRVFEKRLPLD